MALSAGAKKANCWLNTGEGGVSPYHLQGGADLIFQIGTAKNGVRDLEGRLSDDKLREVAAHAQIKMFELKVSQGAKPGKGGILPGEKVDAEIAQIRGVAIGKDVISPNRHREISNYDELIDFVDHIRVVTGKPVGFKFVLGSPNQLDELMQAISRRDIQMAPDFITIDGSEGGTGAAPMALMDSVGLPLREALPALVDSLERYGLRERIKVIASGKLVTPAAVAWALCAGADYIVSARGFMFALGCIQAMQCNKNTCPTGITTHDPKFQRGLDPTDKAERVAHYVQNMSKDVGVIAHSCGVKHPRELSRKHARIVVGGGKTVGMDELFPTPQRPDGH
jgi:glutamate synthase domain-containing protein 2